MGRTRRVIRDQTLNANRPWALQRSVYMTELNDINERFRAKVNLINRQTNKMIQDIEKDDNYSSRFMSEERFDHWMAAYDEEPDENKKKIKQSRLMEQYTCVSTLVIYRLMMLELYGCLTHVVYLNQHIESDDEAEVDSEKEAAAEK